MRPILWILSLPLLLAPIAAPAQQTVLVKAQALSLRAKPSRTADALDKLVSFQPVTLLKRDGDWAQVKTAQDQTGFVLADYLSKRAFVYTGDESINGRLGPGTQYEVILQYKQPNIPLRVLDATADGWLMVKDYEGDRSWIHSKSVKTTGDYVITLQENNNVRKGVGLGQDLAFSAQKGVIFKAVEEKDGWLRVRHGDGDEGWISAKLVYGWNDPAGATSKSEDSGKKSESAAKSSDSEKKTSKADDSESKSAKATTSKSTRKASSAKSDDDEEAATPTRAKSTTRSKAGSSVRSSSSKSGPSTEKSSTSSSGTRKRKRRTAS